MITTVKRLRVAVLTVMLAASTPLGFASSSSEPTPLQLGSNPNTPTNRATTLTVDRAIDRVTDAGLVAPVTAGVAMSQPAATASVSPASGNDWFKSPVIFLSYQYGNQDDKRPTSVGLGYDGSVHTTQVGMDFLTAGDVLVGFIYTAGVTDLKNRPVAPTASTEVDANAHNFNLYASKTFSNWFLLGGTIGYGKTYLDVDVPTFQQDFESDTISAAPFIGAFHTWGAWSVSTVPTYLIQSESRQNNTANALGLVDVSSGALIWKNKVEYAVTEKLVLGLKGDFHQILHLNGESDFITPAARADDNWLAFGPQLVFYPANRWELQVAYEHDLFNQTYDNHRATIGVNYGF